YSSPARAASSSRITGGAYRPENDESPATAELSNGKRASLFLVAVPLATLGVILRGMAGLAVGRGAGLVRAVLLVRLVAMTRRGCRSRRGRRGGGRRLRRRSGRGQARTQRVAVRDVGGNGRCCDVDGVLAAVARLVTDVHLLLAGAGVGVGAGRGRRRGQRRRGGRAQSRRGGLVSGLGFEVGV